ncbi:sensor histidine kinase [Marivirga tractuosa]|uniref:histidine kinase n=1 Tax=Marivirga tractuosa (strain ATCC 23168 / DSM 4126 / NBRC 15989 / NCIMB 1408 / VKM B-1430 / H-43) TaxID=643867 RepID=E4TM62_MARTH|nr:ATP-binding protein [Marivirga tractuosa]ADR21338.1 histidine kinase [Marivirga tractuosa DSM 4126]
MFEDQSEIVFTVIVSSIMLLIIISFIIIMLFIHQKRVLRHQKNIAKLKQKYQEEIMRAQMEMQEETLDYVGRELHDNIGQILSLIKLNLMNAQDQQIRESRKLIGTAIHDLRNISHTLNLTWTENINLTAFIQNTAKSLESSNKYNLQLNLKSELILKNKEDYILVYRMIQEIIQNILKHAEANQIQVFMDEKLLEINDNGRGFDVKTASLGTGIKNIKARASLIGADLEIKSSQNKGSIFRITINDGKYAN